MNVNRPLLNLSAMLATCLVLGQARAAVRLESKVLGVLLDPDFPRVIQYELREGGAVMAGQLTPVAAVELNGRPVPCKTQFKKTGDDSAEYRILFAGPGNALTLRVTVDENVVEWRVVKLMDDPTNQIHSFAFPGNALLTVDSRAGDAQVAFTHATTMDDNYRGSFRENLGPLSDLPVGHDEGNYAFVSAGPLAGGVGCGNYEDILRVARTVSETGGVKSCAVQNPVWQVREFDDEPASLPWVKVFVTGDLNGDGKTDWQDAAVVYRRTMPMPYGHEFVKSTVGENIAMNFASGAQQPFLRILDEVKKGSLITDGLGQQVVIKGFSSEGHDSANTDYAGHYNERAGGLPDFTTLLAHAREYNARVGIHVNASEVYPEAHRYKPEILQRDAKGNPKNGWSWLDQAHMIDKVKDTRSGQLFAALDQMRIDLPNLDFLYVDTYWEHGWPAAQLARKLQQLGLAMYTEGNLSLDPWTAWAHWRGAGSKVMRFIWYSDRDLFGNDALLRGGRSDDDGFLGWQNRHNFNSFVAATFSRRLPAKYLQHFELMRWTPDREALFSNGVKVSKTGEVVSVTQNGRAVMTWMGGGSQARLFVPWSPRTEVKIYVWDEVGTEATWELSPRWRGRSAVWLYRLTDLGRTEETMLPVVDGRVTLTVAKATPYVLYPEKAKAQEPLAWGEGGLVKDPGFDSHGFAAWKPAAVASETGHMRAENDGRGNTRLVISGSNGLAGEVSQVVSGLKGGATYAASVWAQVTGKRLASVAVQPQAPGAPIVSNYVAECKVTHSAPNDPRTGSRYQRLKVCFKMPAGCEQARLTLSGGGGPSTSAVEFDDVRVVETIVSPEASKHWYWEDFEHVDMGYGPFTCCPGERTHLAEANPPYTSDTINGRFSLKSRDGGRVLRTLPCTIRFKPRTRYQIACETLGDGHLTAESGGKTAMQLKFPGGRGRISGEFATGKDTETYLGLYRDGGDFIAIDDLAIDELGPATVPAEVETTPADDRLPGRSILLEDRFHAPLEAPWRTFVSPAPGTRIGAADGNLAIEGGANVSVLAERALPAGTTAVECRLVADADQGQTWGPGVCVLWPGGPQLRLNVRGPDGCFGVDSTAAGQIKAGQSAASESVALRIRIEPTEVVAEARVDGGAWQRVAGFPREKFPGEPDRIRLGKMHGVEGTDDHAAPGAAGTCSFTGLRVYGK